MGTRTSAFWNSSFRQMAQGRLSKSAASTRPPGLLEWIPKLSRSFAAPAHLAPLIRRLEEARTSPLRLVVSTPPRHGKTETLLHAIAWWLVQQPQLSIAYVS